MSTLVASQSEVSMHEIVKADRHFANPGDSVEGHCNTGITGRRRTAETHGMLRAILEFDNKSEAVWPEAESRKIGLTTAHPVQSRKFTDAMNRLLYGLGEDLTL